MAYLLKIDCSPMGENSYSRKLGDSFLGAFKEAHSDVEVKVRNLTEDVPPHLDGEALTAGYVPEEGRSEGMKTKHQYRLDLIKEITEAKSIVVTLPLYNWMVPSNLKSYIDQIIMPGALDPYSFKLLAGKKITCLMSAGGSYGEGSHHPEWDFATPYLKHIFTSLGATDINVLRTEYSLAGVMPGMEGLVEKKEASFAACKEAAEKRAAEALDA